MRSSISPRIAVHYHWLSGISFVMGYLWFLSGLNKIMSSNFPEKFVDFAKSDFLTKDAFGWYTLFFNTVILPHSLFFGYLIEWSELTFGALFFLGALWLFLSDSKVPHIVLALAGAGSFIFILNIVSAYGEFLPTINTQNAFKEGIDADGLALIISIIVFSGNAWELGKAWMLEKNPEKIIPTS